MTKVAIIIERADIALGGAERSVFELASQLSSLGVKTTVLAAKGDLNAKNVQVLCGHGHSKRTSLASFEKSLRRHFSNNHYDIVHSMLPFDFADVYQPRGGSFAEAIIRNTASYESKMVAFCKRFTHYANLRRSAMLLAEKRLCAGSGNTTIAALSEYVKGQFQQHYNLDDKQIAVIRNGVRTNKLVDSDESSKLRNQILGMLGMCEADEPRLFLFAANNFRLKGLRPLIAAMGLLKNRNASKKICLVVAGRGSSRRYRRAAMKCRVSDRIVFLDRVRNIQNALSICDTAVLPTYYDPCSRYILEALVQVKPVITTKFNGASEQFVDKRHGMVLDSPDDIEAIANALYYYADDGNLSRASAAIVHDNLKEKVSIARHAEEIVKLYELILRNRGDKQC